MHLHVHTQRDTHTHTQTHPCSSCLMVSGESCQTHWRSFSSSPSSPHSANFLVSFPLPSDNLATSLVLSFTKHMLLNLNNLTLPSLRKTQLNTEKDMRCLLSNNLSWYTVCHTQNRPGDTVASSFPLPKSPSWRLLFCSLKKKRFKHGGLTSVIATSFGEKAMGGWSGMCGSLLKLINVCLRPFCPHVEWIHFSAKRCFKMKKITCRDAVGQWD